MCPYFVSINHLSIINLRYCSASCLCCEFPEQKTILLFIEAQSMNDCVPFFHFFFYTRYYHVASSIVSVVVFYCCPYSLEQGYKKVKIKKNKKNYIKTLSPTDMQTLYKEH